jgi:hypothetical protein
MYTNTSMTFYQANIKGVSELNKVEGRGKPNSTSCLAPPPEEIKYCN